jgi:hypothetical protein
MQVASATKCFSEDACLTDLVKVHRPGLNSLAVFVEEGAGTFRGGESEDWCLLSVLQLPLVCATLQALQLTRFTGIYKTGQSPSCAQRPSLETLLPPTTP